MGYFIYNGKFLKVGTPIISTANRGLRYGDGLFETMLLQEGKILLEGAHFARLWKGMAVLGFDFPKHFTPEKLSEQILALAKKNCLEKNARVRLQVVRGDGGLYDAANHTPHYIIETGALPENYGTLNSNGLVAGIYHDVKKTADILGNLKHNNFLPYAMAALFAKKQKWNDAFLLNSHERICDSSMANIFIVKNQTVFTPALSEACVAGVMREHIIAALKPSPWKVQETQLTVADIAQADEIFLTNSVYKMRWVKNVGDNVYTHQTIQKLYALLEPSLV